MLPLRKPSFSHGEKTGKTTYEKIYQGIRKIPPGKVATYGQIARMVGRCTARMVGYALAALPAGRGVPWHRVINAQGGISQRSQGDGKIRQRRLLEAEGVCFDPKGRVDLKRVCWTGAARRHPRYRGGTD
jgi:methylated-DNA-protein-cysteine methyltransferase related protein